MRTVVILHTAQVESTLHDAAYDPIMHVCTYSLAMRIFCISTLMDFLLKAKKIISS
jgi:hypothetical protein